MRGTSGPSVRSFGLSNPSFRSGAMSILFICLFIVSAASGMAPHDDAFRYHLHLGRVEPCVMCYTSECWPLQSARCRYYAEASEWGAVSGSGGGSGGGSGDGSGGGSGGGSGVGSGGHSASGGGSVVDSGSGGDDVGDSESVVVVDTLMHNMMSQAVASWMSQECIPFVSQRTDCDKENICLGCESCACDASGRWRCEEVQRCRDEPDLAVDHKVLLYVTDALKNVRNRKKRSEDKTISTPEPQKISYADLVEWMYGKTPDVDDVTNADSVTNKTMTSELNSAETRSKQIITTTPKTDDVRADYIEFDEVLNSIAIDNETYKRRKPQLNQIHQFNDYVDIDLEVPDSDKNKIQKIPNHEDNNDTNISDQIDESTKMVIDLLQGSVNQSHDSLSLSGKVNFNTNVINGGNYPDETHDTISLDAINIMKRDVSSVKSNTTTEATTEINITTHSVPELKKDVLIPLNKIIVDKEQELKDLLKIKENLLRFIAENNETADLNAKSQELLNNTKTVLSIYNLDIFPEIQFNLRKINPNVMEKLLYKMKRDIYEVIRDVVGLKKITATKNLPDDLKTLIRAMSVYVRKQGNITNIKENNIKPNNYLRRHLSNDKRMHMNSTKHYLIKILDILDKSMTQSGVLSPLSPNTRTIINRVIKNTYVDNLSSIGLRVYDPDYNLTNDLENVGTSWHRMWTNVANSEPADKIYALKVFHLTLSAEINKLNDALVLIDFAHSRRMIPIEGSLESVLNKIDKGLKSIHDKIQIIILHKKIQKHLKESTSAKPGSRKSFLKKIRNLLKGSKSDIVQLTNKKVPRSEIVKTVARKRLDELAEKRIAEYSQTMTKWQNVLNIIPRNKRSSEIRKFRNGINHIIPKYLRGKIDPAIFNKKTKVKMDREPKIGKY